MYLKARREATKLNQTLGVSVHSLTPIFVLSAEKFGPHSGQILQKHRVKRSLPAAFTSTFATPPELTISRLASI
jgi:hypothetical protein